MGLRALGSTNLDNKKEKQSEREREGLATLRLTSHALVTHWPLLTADYYHFLFVSKRRIEGENRFAFASKIGKIEKFDGKNRTEVYVN